MRHSRFALAGLALTALATAAFAGELGVGLKAPPLTVAKWVKGKPVKLGDGKIHVVEFWATWCGPCKTSIPHLTELQKKYKDKVTFTGVSIWEDPKATDNAHIEKVESFVKEWGPKMDYTVAADGYEGTMAKEWMEAAEGQGIPTAFIVGGDGKVLWIGHPMAGLDKALDEILAGTYNLETHIAKDKARRENAKARRELMGPIQTALKENDTDTAVRLIDEALAKNPKLVSGIGMLKYNILLKNDTAAAMSWAKTLFEGVGKDNPSMLNALAWPMVDDKSPAKNPDYGLAVKIAERAVELTKEQDAFILDTLAYAYFKNGQIDRAVDVQTKAISVAEAKEGFPAETLKELHTRLDTMKQALKAKSGGGG